MRSLQSSLLAATFAMASAGLAAPARAQDAITDGMSKAGTPTVGRQGSVTVEVGRGQVVVLPGAAANVYVADPKIAEVRPASANSLFVFGTGVGNTTLAALNAAGALVSQLQIAVLPSTANSSAATSAVRRSAPGVGAQVTTTPNGGQLGGIAGTPNEANRAVQTTRQFIPASQPLQNTLSVRSGSQVSLQVTIAEMSRNVTRELGVSWSALGTIAGRYAVGFGNPIGLLTNTGLTSLGSNTVNTSGFSISNIIEALALDNLAHVLSQPNLTAMSGETASFLVGGEFPIPVASENNTISVAFKQYGVALAFVPTVLDSGRINLHVRTEVSALTTAGAVTTGVSNAVINIPAITVRRADTTVELGSGQSFAIAGLLQDTVTQQDSSVPWLGEVPILGTLFRSNSFLHNKSELVIIITPVLAAPVDDRRRLHIPGEDFVPANDTQRNFLTHQIGEPASPVPVRGLPGSLNGFTLQ